MTKIYDLSKKLINIAPGANLLSYERDGAILNAAPMPEYIRLTASGLADNQTATFDLDQYGLDIMPEYLVANFAVQPGNITVGITYFGQIISTYSIQGNNAAAGFQLPPIPISHANATITINTARACNFIWISARQVAVLTNLAQDRIT